MIIYEGELRDFHVDVLYGRIADKLEKLSKDLHVAAGSTPEYRAWQNSLQAMDNVLELSRIDERTYVSIEFQIPLTAKRIDFLVSGLDDEGKSNVIIIELKQWEDASPTDYPDLVNTFVGGANRNVSHPSYQALSYAETLYNFNESVETKDIHLRPCAFLHNFPVSRRRHLDRDIYRLSLEKAPMFLKENRKELAEFIAKYVKKPDQGKAIYELDHGKIRPSKALQDTLASLLKGNREFVLLDDQKVAYERILALARDSKMDGMKRTVIVKGGAGTGKSVLAINLLVETVRSSLKAAYVTKNSAPRNVYFEKLRTERGKFGYLKNLFLSSGKFIDAHEDDFDVLLVDEAHRLNEKSGIFSNLGENQVKEIIRASRLSVFFLDEDQIVTTKDIGSAKEVEKWANEEGSILYSGIDFELRSQFRCNGSDGYIAFLDSFLGIRETANPTLEGLDFDFRLYDDPNLMRDDLRKLNVRNKARMLAGYCYDWVSKSNPLLDDIVIGDFHAKWNLSNTQTWAIDEDSFEEIGCIHTSQGLEFDHVGVIIGKDLLYREGRVVTDPSARAKTDQSMKGLKKNANPALADKIVRDTYKVLLSRGQKSCFVYVEDEALREHLRTLLNKKAWA